MKFLATLCIAALSLASCNSLTPTAESTAEPIDASTCEADGQFTHIPGGEFIAGSDRAERDYAYEISASAGTDDREAIARREANLRDRRWFDREPERQDAATEDFCLQTFPVANRDYAEFVAATGHRAPYISPEDYQTQGFLVHPYEAVRRFLWDGDRPPEGAEDHPVVMVSVSDAETFARWLGDRDGFRYRLPTALEWEKAARGIDGEYFPWGNEWQDEATNWAAQNDGGTLPVGAKPRDRSPFDVGDMAGNVFEYTGTQQLGRVVMKGCSWDDSPGFCRAAYRHTRPPESRHILFGFRLVRDAAAVR